MVKAAIDKNMAIGSYKWETPKAASVMWSFDDGPAPGSDTLTHHEALLKSGVFAKKEPADSTDVKWCAVSLSEVIDRGYRLEAGVFDVEAKQAFKQVTNGKYPAVPLISSTGPVISAYYGNRHKRNYVPKDQANSIGFIGSSEMLDIYPQPVKHMKNCPSVDEMRVKEGIVLLSRSGTIGNVSFVNKTLSRFLISEHAIRLNCANNPGYVYAFLKSKTGKRMINSNIYGAVIQQIEPEHLAEIPIPDAPEALKAEIHQRVARSYELRDESNELIDEATALLIKELQLPPLHALKPQVEESTTVETFHIKLSNLDGRADASYHIPVKDAITEHLHAHAGEVTTVEDSRISCDVILPGRFKRVYVEEGYGVTFIGGKQLGELNPSNKKYLSPTHHSDRIKNQLELHENMTLITCSGTIGKVALVGKHWECWTANQHIIRIIPAYETIAGYLYIFLASDYGHALITKYTYGSVVDEIDDNHVRQIPIPLLKNQDIQTRINDLALKANDKRYEAFLLEQEAIDMMNEQVIFA